MSHRPVIAVRQEPELSIVVCSLGGPGLEKTAESLHASAQASGRPYEIIAVWQTDAAPPELGDDVRVVEIFPVGLSHARNRGLAVARAPVVGFVDDDELVDPGWASAALAAFAAVPRPAAAFGPVAPLDNRGLPYCHLEPGEPRVFFGPATPPWIVGTGGNMAFDREELIAVGGFDPLLGAGAEGQAGEETDVIMRLLRQAKRIVWVPELGVYHPTKDESEHLAIRFPYAYGMGRAMRKHREVPHLAGYLLAIRDSRRTARREGDERRRREAGQTLRGFLAGALGSVDRSSPVGALAHAPEELRPLLAGEDWQPLPLSTDGSIRLGYRRGDDLLEVWIDPDSDAAEQAARDGATAAAGRDSLWILRAASSVSSARPSSPGRAPAP